MTKDGEWGIVSHGGDARDAGRRGAASGEAAADPADADADARPGPRPPATGSGERLPGVDGSDRAP